MTAVSVLSRNGALCDREKNGCGGDYFNSSNLVSLVSGAPGRPIIYEPPSTNLDVSSFTLKWKRPDDDGGDANIVYKISYRDETDPDIPGPWNNEETSELEADIKDLDAKWYKFEVRAANEGGESEPAEKYYRISRTGGMNAVLIAQFIVIVHRLSQADVSQDDSQRRLLAQHSITTLLRNVSNGCNIVPTLLRCVPLKMSLRIV